MILRITCLILLILGSVLPFFSSVHAACTIDLKEGISTFLQKCGADTKGIKPLTNGEDSTKELVRSIAEKAIAFGSVIVVGFIVWAGIQYTTAYGDDEKLKHAKSTIIYAVGGLFLLLASFGLVDVIVNFIFSFGANT